MSQLLDSTRSSSAVRVQPYEPACDTAIFERLPISPAPAFLSPRLRLVGEEHRNAGARGAAAAGERARARAHERRPVRLTRRGRLAMVIVFALITTAAMFALGLVPSQASTSSGGAGPAARVAVATVTVQPGDTLWSIASRVAPRADPRITVQRIIERNALPDAGVEVGQVLVVPS